TDFSYTDSRGSIWLAPKGTISDGASIPRVFWTYIGGPLSGLYRKASIIHDYYCDTRSRPAGDVHRVFYEGLLQSGVRSSKAWVMYQAVALFGPNWAPSTPSGCGDGEQINLADCVENFGSSAPLETPQSPTPENLEKFYQKLHDEGYGAEAEALRASVD
ncbi:MAG: DUF1353 domain-containing protein, partial [Pseudomonadota bacterium]